ncbi:MAG TPA: hypothetical protein VH417_05760 [Vicinamibacterales bacterium]|jgi:hypothetical protein
MFQQHLRIAAALAASGVLAVAAAAADKAPLRRDADQLKLKVEAIRGRSVAPEGRPVRTAISEREVNAYLVYEFAQTLPAGVVEPSITILGPNRLSGRALVDLDRVRASAKPTSRLDPMYYLSGRMPVAATGVLKTHQGVGEFQLESAEVAGVPVPKFVLQQIVTYYSRSAEQPSGISIDRTFELPANIKEIQVDRGQAIVVQ